jgi:hypothetical protein
MSRYIDADVVIIRIDEQIQMPTFMDCLSAINSAPSIDIIRCKDCIYYEALGYDAPKDGWCNSPKLYCDGFWVDEDDFCSDAKRED